MGENLHDFYIEESYEDIRVNKSNIIMLASSILNREFNRFMLKMLRRRFNFSCSCTADVFS